MIEVKCSEEGFIKSFIKPKHHEVQNLVWQWHVEDQLTVWINYIHIKLVFHW